MSALQMNDLLGVVLECMELQMRASRDWHWGDPDYEPGVPGSLSGLGGLRELAMRQHWVAFRLHHADEDGLGEAKAGMLAGQGEELVRAMDAHLAALLAAAGFAGCGLSFGESMAELSRLGLAAHHLREEGKDLSHHASHAQEDARAQRAAEAALERVGEVDTRRMVLGRALLDALHACGASGAAGADD